MPIRILSPEVVVRIAAGEVIERPASVVKELLENAIDAGASEIAIEIAQGGRRLVRVSDNGCGIPADEVELAFARHATSKLRSAEDLYRIQTLGFRGEALASIAAVSRVTLSTRAADEETGTLIRLEGGRILHREGQGRPPGTTVAVENLFFNTPARLKFLRSDTTEASQVARLVSSYALIYAEKRLSLENNGRLILRTLGTGSLYDVLVTLYGLDIAEQLIEIPPFTEEGITVSGQISAPSLHRANRRDILLFVNRRWIQDTALSYAIGEAYRTLLPQGRHPLVVLSLTLPPEDVDVNIHPTKQEVRFRRQREVFTAVQRAVRTALMRQYPVPVAQVPGPSAASRLRAGQDWRALFPAQAQLPVSPEEAGRRLPLAMPLPVEEPQPSGRLPMLRVVGQIAQTYIVAEGPGGMYLIDQHAAHERIRYEELRAQRASQGVASQELLDPVTIELSPQQAVLLEENLETLLAYGFEILPFGGSTFLVKRVPAGLAAGDVSTALGEMLDAALEGKEGFSWEDQALITLSCHTAVRAGKALSPEEMRDLVRQLERTALPHTCPHGRPTLVHFSQAQLERQFDRR